VSASKDWATDALDDINLILPRLNRPNNLIYYVLGMFPSNTSRNTLRTYFCIYIKQGTKHVGRIEEGYTLVSRMEVRGG
jgi:hypothetical protein